MFKLRLGLCAIWLITAGVFPLRADLATRLPDDWFTRPPMPERLVAVQAAADSDGWSPVAGRLFQGAMRGYELRQEEAAAAWYLVARWCDLFGQSQAKAEQRWLENNQQAGLRFVAAGRRARFPDAPVADLLKSEMRAWLLTDRKFAEAFFGLLSPYDCVPEVMTILQSLRDAEPNRFNTYAHLAMAIALVYDTRPAPQWPHWQVSDSVLPRRLPPPERTFKFLIESDQKGMTLHKLATIPAMELRFLVDIAVSSEELVWAQRAVKFPLNSLVKSYEAVRYRNDRILTGQYVWPGESYELPTIYSEGGICVDQAFFATQAGKARGVPTLLFSGAGKDGRHAWFGYLGTGQKWTLDAGRYAEQRYVIGVAIDPQTWMQLSDHELAFLSEGFRRLPPYRLSLQHQLFAELYLRIDQKPAAAAAARKAVNHERRNVEAWKLLIAANADAPARTREGLLREAAQAMQKHPDLNAMFVRELAASLRARGETAAAEFEERSLVRRGRSDGRVDLGVDHAVAVMSEAQPPEQLRVYRQLLQQYGRDAGIAFYDRVTKPLVLEMIAARRKAEAQQVLAQTRAQLKPEAGSQFDRELTELTAKAK